MSVALFRLLECVSVPAIEMEQGSQHTVSTPLLGCSDVSVILLVLPPCPERSLEDVLTCHRSAVDSLGYLFTATSSGASSKTIWSFGTEVFFFLLIIQYTLPKLMSVWAHFLARFILSVDRKSPVWHCGPRESFPLCSLWFGLSAAFSASSLGGTKHAPSTGSVPSLPAASQRFSGPQLPAGERG